MIGVEADGLVKVLDGLLKLPQLIVAVAPVDIGTSILGVE